jgi:uncharacterized protein
LNFQFHLSFWQEFSINANSLLKVSLFFIIWAIFWLPIAIPLAWRLKWHPSKPLTGELKLPLLGTLYAIAPFLVWGTAKVENTTFFDYGLAWQGNFFLSTLVGLGLGISGLIAVFGIEAKLGWLQWQTENLLQLRSILLPLLALGLWIGITEELIFRGFLLEELQQDYSIAIAAIVSSLIFALLHLVWERQQTLPQLPGLWLMGMVLVGARLVDNGSLGLACGLHAGWIWGLTAIDSSQLIAYTGKGRPWITGIGGQPLAGLAGLLCLIGTGIVLGTSWLHNY